MKYEMIAMKKKKEIDLGIPYIGWLRSGDLIRWQQIMDLKGIRKMLEEKKR
jgi:hypothetical protein